MPPTLSSSTVYTLLRFFDFISCSIVLHRFSRPPSTERRNARLVSKRGATNAGRKTFQIACRPNPRLGAKRIFEFACSTTCFDVSSFLNYFVLDHVAQNRCLERTDLWTDGRKPSDRPTNPILRSDRIR